MSVENRTKASFSLDVASLATSTAFLPLRSWQAASDPQSLTFRAFVLKGKFAQVAVQVPLAHVIVTRS
jgi:hypothetical protein